MLEQGLSNASRKAELFANLLNSIEAEFGEQFDVLEQVSFDEWQTNGPVWGKLIVCEILILVNRVNNLGKEPRITLDSLSEVRSRVWQYFKNLPPKDVGETEVRDEFLKLVSSSELPERLKGILLGCLRQPFKARENKFREIVGLSRIGLEENGKGI